MGRILSGGYKGFSQQSERQPSQSYEREEPSSIPEESPEEQEGWGSYLVRNTAKAPFVLAKAARSGLGLGNVAELAARKVDAPESVRGALKTLLPTYQQAGEEQEQYLPKYLTESKPGDYLPELAATEIPLAIATGGGSIARRIALGAVGTAGALAGGTVGKYAGGEIGEALGDREIGEAVGSIAGGVGGGLGARRLTPSQALGPKVEQAKKSAFDTDKAQRMASAEKEFGSKIQGLTQEERRSALALPKEKSKFESVKKDQVNGVRQEINQYDSKIKALDNLRKPAYDAASKLEEGSRGSAAGLKNTIKDIESSIAEGVSPADRKSIMDNVGSLEDAIKNGELTLKQAKNFQKNFNDQIYNFGVSNSFKRQMNKMTSSLNDFIQENGSPEHNQNWMRGEQATRELKSLKRDRKDFVSLKNQQIRDLSKEKFPAEQEFHLKEQSKAAKQDLKTVQEQREKVISALGKETYEGLLNSKSEQQKTADALERLASVASNFGIGGLGAVLSYFSGLGKTPSILLGLSSALGSTVAKEFRLAKEVLKNHPDIFKDYMKLVKNAATMDASRAARQLDELGRRVEEYIPNDEHDNAPSGGRILSGGFKG